MMGLKELYRDASYLQSARRFKCDQLCVPLLTRVITIHNCLGSHFSNGACAWYARRESPLANHSAGRVKGCLNIKISQRSNDQCYEMNLEKSNSYVGSSERNTLSQQDLSRRYFELKMSLRKSTRKAATSLTLIDNKGTKSPRRWFSPPFIFSGISTSLLEL